MAFPSPPWDLRAQAWLSLFRAAPPGEERGTYAVAFVSYEPGGTLDYSELLVARRADDSPQRGALATVRSMWVDSAASREGGRALWSIPKELAGFRHETGRMGPVGRDSWQATLPADGAADDRVFAAAEFVDASRLALRAPFRGRLWQPRGGGGGAVALVRGSGRGLPCLATWTFDPAGPLGWLAGRHPLVSLRLHDVRLDIS